MKKIWIGRKKNSNKIKVVNLLKINNSKGDIQLIEKFNNEQSKKIKELYCTWINYNQIKGWNFHKKMTVTLIVLLGRVKFVIYEPKNLLFKSYIIGENKVKKIIIPPGFFFGIKNLSRSKSLILNMASIKHSKKEFIKIPLNKIKYSW